MTKRITIIGGGASGTLLAVNLLMNTGGQPLDIHLIEKRSRLARGVAYGTALDSHLLNVPAGKMGAFPDDIEHFHRWLVANGHTFDAHAFVPRMIFGEYLRDALNEATRGTPSGVNIELIDDEAVDLNMDGERPSVTLRSGRAFATSQVVLAFGNFHPPHPSVPDLGFVADERYFQDPWDGRLYDTIGPDESIFIIGTGLSMVDLAMHFHKRGHRGKISAISTRGMLPAVHELGYTYPSFYDELRDLRRITDLLKAVRRHVEIAENDGSNWRAVIDSLRPATQQIWLDLPVAEKRYFKQHLSRYWNVARHRMPPEAATVLDEMRAKGTLEIPKGRLKSIRHNSEGFTVDFTRVGVQHSVTADTLVNCIGSQSDITRLDSELVRNLLASGLIRPDQLSLGIDARPDGTVIHGNGQPAERLFTLGTSLKGILWESTAIPEIRAQARQLALKLLAD